MLSFETAWKMKADMVELDVRATSDDQLVCIHDADVSRITGKSGVVAEMTLKELRRLDAGKGQRIPLLAEVLGFAQGKLEVDIELKVAGIEKDLLRLVKERKMIGSVIFSSFLHSTLEDLRHLDLQAKTAVLYSEPMDDPVHYALDLKSNAINPLFYILTPEQVSLAHRSGLKTYPWTVNDPEMMTQLLSMEVDGLVTDYPDIAVQTFDSYFG
jgi:glycerophosphoryl diester phosphodiesterase